MEYEECIMYVGLIPAHKGKILFLRLSSKVKHVQYKENLKKIKNKQYMGKSCVENH